MGCWFSRIDKSDSESSTPPPIINSPQLSRQRRQPAVHRVAYKSLGALYAAEERARLRYQVEELKRKNRTNYEQSEKFETEEIPTTSVEDQNNTVQINNADKNDEKTDAVKKKTSESQNFLNAYSEKPAEIDKNIEINVPGQKGLLDEEVNISSFDYDDFDGGIAKESQVYANDLQKQPLETAL